MKNHIIKALRIDNEMANLLQEASTKLGIRQPDLIRFLLNRSLKQLKCSAIEAGGFENLEFSLKR